MKFRTLLALGLLPLLGSIAQAHIETFTATLNGANEAPPNASLGTGLATVTLDLDLVTMRVQVNFSGLTGNVTAAHIHAPTAVAGTGTASVATTTPTFTNFPLGVTAGTYDVTYDMTQASSYNASFITNNGGTVSTALTALVNSLSAGTAYLNIHSSFAAGGEIRGFLAPVSAIPEPGSVALWIGLAGAMVVVGKRRSLRRVATCAASESSAR